MLFTLLISLILFFSFLLMIAVLAQNPKGGGLSSSFGGSSASNIIGVKKTSEFLEKLTWGLIAGIMILALVTYYVGPGGSSSNDSILDNIEESGSNAAPASTPEPTLPADTTK